MNGPRHEPEVRALRADKSAHIVFEAVVRFADAARRTLVGAKCDMLFLLIGELKRCDADAARKLCVAHALGDEAQVRVARLRLLEAERLDANKKAGG